MEGHGWHNDQRKKKVDKNAVSIKEQAFLQ